MAAKGNPADPAKPVPVKKGGISLMVVLILVLVAAGGSAAAVWFLVPHSAAAKPAEAGEPAAHGDEHAEAGHADAHAEGGHAEGGEKKDGQIQYLALDPVFVVNTADEDVQHYLQTDVQVTSRSSEALEAVKMHMPRIRNNLLMLFSQQKTTDVRDRAGRERLQAAALKEVQDVLKAETGKPGVEALYFTSFVTQ